MRCDNNGSYLKVDCQCYGGIETTVRLPHKLPTDTEIVKV